MNIQTSVLIVVLLFSTSANGAGIPPFENGQIAAISIAPNYCKKKFSWNISAITTPARASFLSFVLDKFDTPYIAFSQDNPDLNVSYMTTNPIGGWDIQPVVTDILNSDETSIAVDNHTKVYISTSVSSAVPATVFAPWIKSLIFSTNLTDHWESENLNTILGPGDTGRMSSLKLDSKGKVHISYTRWEPVGNNKTIVSLNYVTNASGQWVTQVVDPFRVMGDSTSLAIDKNDGIHITYNRFLPNNNNDVYLAYATLTKNGWIIENPDIASPATRSSLTMDDQNQPHIAYYSPVPGILKYATRTKMGWGGGWVWVVESVDVPKIMGQFGGDFPSIALTQSRAGPIVHISYYYYDGADGALKYANKCNGNWTTSFVDHPPGGKVGSDTNIAIDRAGKVHIVYEDYEAWLRGGHDVDTIKYAVQE